MSETLERVTKAICMSRHGGYPVSRDARLKDSDNWKGSWWWQAEKDARAAIEANVAYAVSVIDAALSSDKETDR